MASSTPASFYKTFTPFSNPKLQKYPPVRSQRFRDEGNSSNIVDGNMSTLRQRIEQVRMKERLNKFICYRQEKNGWNYKPGYDDTYKRRVGLVQFFEVAASVGSTLGLVFLTGSIFIFLYSLVIQNFLEIGY
ncbi:hypothetical protein ACH5RR_036273 [Cinchona calisaya]|uniref:Uncharacterized protein n=1 Tax=Cinchona calisaya TaxID=153742 RepID=A0ABD2Y2Q9_9GENT